jgi:hypothetical protein
MPAPMAGSAISTSRAMKSQRRREILESRNQVKNWSHTEGRSSQRVNR